MGAPDVRVCVLGDSFTAGVGDPTGAGWVGPVAAAARSAGWDLTAYALGVRRDTSVDVARRWLAETSWRLRDGDRYGVVVAVGLNDVVLQDGCPRVSRERSLAALAEVLDGASSRGWPALVIGPPPVSDAEESARAADLSAGMAAACAARAVPFVDTTGLALDPVWVAEVASGDAYHPSTRGYARLAALVRPAFDRWLAERVAGRVAVPGGGVTRPLPAGLSARHPVPEDHGRVLAGLHTWWGGFGGPDGARQRALLLPRLFFEHFTDTSWVVEDAAGDLRAFLVGFRSSAQPDVGYVHVVGVDPALRRQGLASALYRRFAEHGARRGARRLACLTSPGNTTSLRFHRGLGFDVVPGDDVVDGVPIHRDHDGPGLHRVLFTLALDEGQLRA